MTTFRRLAIASAAATFLLIAIGGLVRATKSGLGCGTNWPDCPGAVTRALVIELSHRAVAGVVVVLLGALAVIAVKRYRDRPRLMWASVAAFGLVLFQALLGAIVVWLELEAESVVLHLATALVLLALLAYTVLEADEARTRVETGSGLGTMAAVAAGLILAVLLVGSYVTGIGAGAVFPDWPLMDGRIVPDLGSEAEAVHFLHRALALLAGVFVAALAVTAARARGVSESQRRLTRGVTALFGIEVIVGAGNVWSDLNAFFVTAHLAIGAGIWLGLVTLTLTSHPVLSHEPAFPRVKVRRPVASPDDPSVDWAPR